MRIGTERMLVSEDFRPVALGGPSNLHLDIIMGRDTKIDVEDIFNGYSVDGGVLILDYELANVPFHTEVEKRLRI